MRPCSILLSCGFLFLNGPALAVNCTLTPTYAITEGTGEVPSLLLAGAVLVVLDRPTPVYRACELAVEIDVSGAILASLQCQRKAWPSAIPVTISLQTYAATSVFNN